MGQNERDKSPAWSHCKKRENNRAPPSQFICDYEWNAFSAPFRVRREKNSISKFPNAISNPFGYLSADKWICETQLFISHRRSICMKIETNLHANGNTLTINAATKRNKNDYYEINRVRSTINYRLSNEDKAHKGIKREIISHSFYVRST